MTGKLKKSDKTRQYVIEKAAPVFNTKGYYGTSLHDLTQATGLTKGGIYGNFQNKDDIALAAYEYNSRQILDRIKTIVLSDKGSVQVLHDITAFYRQYIYNSTLAGGCPILNTAIEADDTHEDLHQKVLASLDYLRRSFIFIIERGMTNGEFKQHLDTEHYATIFISLIEGGIMQMKVYRKSRYLKQSLQHMDQLIENMKSE
jgi:AcrR family transcriptional regulator